MKKLSEPQERALVAFYYFRDARTINGNVHAGLYKAGVISDGGSRATLTPEGEETAKALIERQLKINSGK